MGSLLRLVQTKIIDFFDRTGFADLVGGRASLEAGMGDLRAAALPVYAELLQVHGRNEPLACAVFDEQRYPHLARLHGWLLDVMTMPVPEPLLPWIQRIMALAPDLDDAGLRRLLGVLAFRAPGVIERTLGRLVFFEMLCLTQRIELMRAGVNIEIILGRREDVEAVAEHELSKIETSEEYREALRDLKDPGSMVQVVLGASIVSLHKYVEILRRELTWISETVADTLTTRQRLLEALDGTDPTDALLIRNACASVFGDERVTIEQLRIRHPGLTQGLSASAARKRLERALKRATRSTPGEHVETLGSLLLQHLRELES